MFIETGGNQWVRVSSKGIRSLTNLIPPPVVVKMGTEGATGFRSDRRHLAGESASKQAIFSSHRETGQGAWLHESSCVWSFPLHQL